MLTERRKTQAEIKRTKGGVKGGEIECDKGVGKGKNKVFFVIYVNE